MTRIYKKAEELIGNTPLLELTAVEKDEGLHALLLAKAEGFNPSGSVKDRMAKVMLDEAETRGEVGKNTVLLIPSSGNAGIGFAAIAAQRGYRLIVTMPDSMSVERRKLLTAYGAEVVLTKGKDGMQGAIEETDRLARELSDSFVLRQFEDESNAKAHYLTTGPEIWRDTGGKVDIFVCGVGTGGTISGVGRYLKEKNPAVVVVAVEPDSSAVLSGENAGGHGLQGIGAGFVPPVLDTSVYDEVIRVSEAQAIEQARKTAKREGLLIGISSGAALGAAIEVAKRAQNEGKTIVVLFADGGERYLSSALYQD